MDKVYFARLPNDLQQMIDEIENKSGINIEVKIDSSRAGKYLNEPGSLACKISETQAQLLIPSYDIFPDGAVLHELLHIQRFLVDGVPQIAVCEHSLLPELEKTFTQIDNMIEHLIIVPKELIQRPERRERWITLMERLLTQLQANEVDIADRDALAIYSWVFIDHVLGNDSLRKKCTSVLVPLNLMARALEFRHAVTPALASKEATVRIFVEQFNLADEFLCLDYLEPRQGTCHQRILP